MISEQKTFYFVMAGADGALVLISVDRLSGSSSVRILECCCKFGILGFPFNQLHKLSRYGSGNSTKI